MRERGQRGDVSGFRSVVCCRIENRRGRPKTDGRTDGQQSNSVVRSCNFGARLACRAAAATPWAACEQKLFMSKSSKDELLLSAQISVLFLLRLFRRGLLKYIAEEFEI